MKLTIFPRTALDPSILALVQQRFRFALGRFGHRVVSVTVRLSDVNGPRGGADKRCAVAVRLHRLRRQIIVEDIDAIAAVAISHAAARTSRALARAIEALNDRPPARRQLRANRGAASAEEWVGASK